MKVLIVDDSRIMRNIVKNTLLSIGIQVDDFFEAPDGAEAYKLILNNKIDLLFLDWNMPMLNGLELVQRLRREPEHASLPIIMVTSEAAKYNVIEAVKAGVNDYLVKPVTEAKLRDKVNHILATRGV